MCRFSSFVPGARRMVQYLYREMEDQCAGFRHSYQEQEGWSSTCTERWRINVPVFVIRTRSKKDGPVPVPRDGGSRCRFSSFVPGARRMVQYLYREMEDQGAGFRHSYQEQEGWSSTCTERWRIKVPVFVIRTRSKKDGPVPVPRDGGSRCQFSSFVPGARRMVQYLYREMEDQCAGFRHSYQEQEGWSSTCTERWRIKVPVFVIRTRSKKDGPVPVPRDGGSRCRFSSFVPGARRMVQYLYREMEDQGAGFRHSYQEQEGWSSTCTERWRIKVPVFVIRTRSKKDGPVPVPRDGGSMCRFSSFVPGARRMVQYLYREMEDQGAGFRHSYQEQEGWSSTCTERWRIKVPVFVIRTRSKKDGPVPVPRDGGSRCRFSSFVPGARRMVQYLYREMEDQGAGFRHSYQEHKNIRKKRKKATSV